MINAQSIAVRSTGTKRAFTVLELLLAVTLLSLITYALYSMFSQTQKALHANVSQTDVSEGARASLDLLVRDLEQAVPSKIFGMTNFIATRSALGGVIQQTLDANVNRTNLVQEIFFLTKFNRDFIGIGYRVTGVVGGVGTLSRFMITTNASQLAANNLLRAFNSAEGTNLQRVADGVIHLRVIPYDVNGRIQLLNATSPLDKNVRVINIRTLVMDPYPTDFSYSEGALPPYLDLEVAFLEPSAFEQYRSMPAPAQQGFLNRNLSKVHIFRQRIALHSAPQ